MHIYPEYCTQFNVMLLFVCNPIINNKYRGIYKQWFLVWCFIVSVVWISEIRITGEARTICSGQALSLLSVSTISMKNFGHPQRKKKPIQDRPLPSSFFPPSSLKLPSGGGGEASFSPLKLLPPLKFIPSYQVSSLLKRPPPSQASSPLKLPPSSSFSSLMLPPSLLKLPPPLKLPLSS